jgi:lipopolysaccharide/colanic/teichoic acid biosynthesis glycosyltransferase
MFITVRNQDTSIALRSSAGRSGRARRLEAGLLWEFAQRLLGLALLIFVLPVLLATALAVLAQDGGPVLFKHRRIGRGGHTFGCLKLRTMAVDAEARLTELLHHDPAAREEWARDQKLRNDPRITPLGRFLRQSSLDELPQLINVVRGEMNLVGPRPIVESEIARYGRRFRSYRAVKPGITGLWQVSGRNDVAYRTRVALDTLYAQRRSIGLDLWIIVRTVPAVLLRQGSC